MSLEWKRRTRKKGPLRVSWQGFRLISLTVDLWLWKWKLYPRKRKARR
jgi:hypothetical protein